MAFEAHVVAAVVIMKNYVANEQARRGLSSD